MFGHKSRPPEATIDVLAAVWPYLSSASKAPFVAVAEPEAVITAAEPTTVDAVRTRPLVAEPLAS